MSAALLLIVITCPVLCDITMQILKSVSGLVYIAKQCDHLQIFTIVALSVYEHVLPPK